MGDEKEVGESVPPKVPLVVALVVEDCEGEGEVEGVRVPPEGEAVTPPLALGVGEGLGVMVGGTHTKRLTAWLYRSAT